MLLGGATHRIAARRRRSRALILRWERAPPVAAHDSDRGRPGPLMIMSGQDARGPKDNEPRCGHWSARAPARRRPKRPSAVMVAWPWGGIPMFATETRRHWPTVTGVEATVTIEGG